MRIFVPRETQNGESRVALVPEAVRRLTELGPEIFVEGGLGAPVSITGEVYQNAMGPGNGVEAFRVKRSTR